jgi:DnaK suppressor protein
MMKEGRARELLDSERLRTQQTLADLLTEGRADRDEADQPGDMFDSAEPLLHEGTNDAAVVELQEHLAAIERAQKRLDSGTYGLSVRSGLAIPDERLEADPAAELTVDEASMPG